MPDWKIFRLDFVSTDIMVALYSSDLESACAIKRWMFPSTFISRCLDGFYAQKKYYRHGPHLFRVPLDILQLSREYFLFVRCLIEQSRHLVFRIKGGR